MPPLTIIGFTFMVASLIVSGFDAVRTMREGREPERRMRAFLIAGALLIVGGVLVVISAVTS